MTPTLEEVKKVANILNIPLQEDNQDQWAAITVDDLRSFAQHWMKVQRELDAALGNGSTYDAVRDLCEAIRNNTGE